jgi:hypothetical protein
MTDAPSKGRFNILAWSDLARHAADKIIAVQFHSLIAVEVANVECPGRMALPHVAELQLHGAVLVADVNASVLGDAGERIAQSLAGLLARKVRH